MTVDAVPVAAAMPAPVSGAPAEPVAESAYAATESGEVASFELPPSVSSPPPAPVSSVPVGAAPEAVGGRWLAELERDARARLESGQSDVWDSLTRQFEASLIHTALELTRGRRIEAAQKLGIGRNTITRKIQELGIDD